MGPTTPPGNDSAYQGFEEIIKYADTKYPEDRPEELQKALETIENWILAEYKKENPKEGT